MHGMRRGAWAHGVQHCQVAIHVAKDGFTLKNDMQLPPYISGQCASRFCHSGPLVLTKGPTPAGLLVN